MSHIPTPITFNLKDQFHSKAEYTFLLKKSNGINRVKDENHSQAKLRFLSNFINLFYKIQAIKFSLRRLKVYKSKETAEFDDNPWFISVGQIIKH